MTIFENGHNLKSPTSFGRAAQCPSHGFLGAPSQCPSHGFLGFKVQHSVDRLSRPRLDGLVTIRFPRPDLDLASFGQVLKYHRAPEWETQGCRPGESTPLSGPWLKGMRGRTPNFWRAISTTVETPARREGSRFPPLYRMNFTIPPARETRPECFWHRACFPPQSPRGSRGVRVQLFQTKSS